MAKKKTITDADGNVYVESSPFYKKAWFWIVVAVVVVIGFFIAIGSNGSDTDSTPATSSKSAKVSNTKQEKDADDTEKTKTKAATIDIDNAKASVLKTLDFKPNYINKDWAPAVVSIDEVKVNKIKPFTDKEEHNSTYNGIILVHFKIQANQDLNMYPNQATLVTSDGQQVEANMYSSDDYDGEINKGVTKSGTTLFALTTMNSATDLKTLRLKWSGDYDTDNYDDNNSSHDYDITINLQ